MAPKIPKLKECNIVPFSPRKFIPIPDDGGRSQIHEIFEDRETKRQVLQCQLCGRFIVYSKSFQGFLSHRSSQECVKYKARLEEQKIQEEAHRALFSSGLVSRPVPTHTLPQDVQRVDGATSRQSYEPSPAEGAAGIEAFEGSDPHRMSLRAEEPPMDSLRPPTPEVTMSEPPTSGAPPPPIKFQESTPIATLTQNNPGPSTFSSTVPESPHPQCENPCKGQPIQWTAGPVLETYPFQLHTQDDIKWMPVGFMDHNRIVLRSKACRSQLSTPKEQRTQICSRCATLLYFQPLQRCMERAKSTSSHTPYRFLSWKQLADALHETERKHRMVTTQRENLKRQILRLKRKEAENDVPADPPKENLTMM